MRAVALNYETRAPQLYTLAEPGSPRAGEVRYRIRACGVCATDRELARFRFGAPPDGESCLVLGHEALGEVTHIGDGVTQFAPGDLVVPLVRRACAPICAACANARPDLCESGAYLERGIQRLHGYFTEMAVDAARDLIAVPRALAERAVLAEPLSVVEKAIERAFALHSLDARTALVIGCGPVALLCAYALRVRGLDVEVASLEPEDAPRVALVRRCGARYVRLPVTPARADLVFEASGGRDAARLAVGLMRANAACVLIGASELPLELDTVALLVNNHAIAGVVNAARAHFDRALTDLAAMPDAWLDGFVERRVFDAWPESLRATPRAPKAVHCLD